MKCVRLCCTGVLMRSERAGAVDLSVGGEGGVPPVLLSVKVLEQ